MCSHGRRQQACERRRGARAYIDTLAEVSHCSEAPPLSETPVQLTCSVAMIGIWSVVAARVRAIATRTQEGISWMRGTKRCCKSQMRSKLLMREGRVMTRAASMGER